MCGQSFSHPQICAVQPNSSYWRHWNSATLAISQASLWSYPLHVVRRDGDTKRVMSNDCLTSFHWPVPSICANVAPRWGWFFVKMCRISTCGCSEESVAPMSKTRWTYLKLLGWFHTHCLHTHKFPAFSLDTLECWWEWWESSFKKSLDEKSFKTPPEASAAGLRFRKKAFCACIISASTLELLDNGGTSRTCKEPQGWRTRRTIQWTPSAASEYLQEQGMEMDEDLLETYLLQQWEGYIEVARIIHKHTEYKWIQCMFHTSEESKLARGGNPKVHNLTSNHSGVPQHFPQ